MIGRTIGGYRIVEQVGMGGMATVYKAYDASTDRYVALKTLPEQYSKDPQFVERFRREAIAIAKLEHLHILPLFAYGEDNGVAYLAMRYLPAGTLSNLIRQKGQMPLEEIARILNQIASALDHAHANGVLHRDIKPSNVLIDKDSNVYLTDFGIARMVEGTVDLTGDAILGTPQYMSPEQCQARKDLTPASDQYSLGVVLYEMVTGRVPYQAETPLAVIIMQLNGADLPLPSLLRPDLPDAAERVILKALSREPADRYPSCEAMAKAFTQAIREKVPATQPNVQPATKAAAAPPTLQIDNAPTTIQPSSTPTPLPAVRPALSPTLIGALVAAGIIVIGGIAFLAGRPSTPAATATLAPTSAQIAAVSSATAVPTTAEPSATMIAASDTPVPSATAAEVSAEPSATVVTETVATIIPTTTESSASVIEPSFTPTSKVIEPSFTPTPKAIEPSFTPTPKVIEPSFTPTPKVIEPSFTPTPTNVPATFTPVPNSLPSIVSTLIAQGDTDPAVNLLSPAIEQTPKDGQLYLLRGEAYHKSGNTDDALTDYTQAIALSPDLVDAYMGRAYIYYDRNDTESAIKDLTQALKVQPNRADVYALRGQIFRSLSDYEQSLADYNKAVEIDPKNPQWYVERATTYEYQGNLDAAVTDLNRAIELNPQFAAAYIQRANDQRQRQQYELALADIMSARRLDPNNVSTYSGPVETYLTILDSGGSFSGYDLDMALADANKAIELVPDDWSLYNDRGRVHAYRSEHDEAISDLTQSIKLNDQAWGPYVNRGYQYTSTQQWDLAHADFNKALELNPDSIEAYQGRIEASLEAADNDKPWKDYDLKAALADANAAYDRDSGNSVTLLLRGKVYGRLGDKEKALADLKQTIEISPDMAWGYQERGYIYNSIGMVDAAVADFKKAIELDPTDPWNYAGLGDVYYDAGRHKEALEAYKTYVDKAGDSAVQYVRDRIAELEKSS